MKEESTEPEAKDLNITEIKAEIESVNEMKKKVWQTLDRVYIDLVGPTTPSADHFTGAMITWDKGSNFVNLATIKDKMPETILKHWRSFYPGKAGDEPPTHPKSVYCDNGGEFRGEFEKYIEETAKATFRRSLPYRPQTNAVQERLHKTIEQGVKASMSISGAPLKFWSFALRCWVYNFNRT